MTSSVGSRRERPAKPPLSREWIIAETIKIAQEEGLAKATMRRVATALDTGPASLYVYVANTAELHAAVTDELTGTLPADAEGTWAERLERLLSAYSHLLVSYPGLARSALQMRPMGPNTVRLFDRILGLLLEGEVAADRAAWGADLLVQHATANAAEHSAPAVDDAYPAPFAPEAVEAINATIRGADARDVPHIARHADLLLSGSPEQRSSWATRALIAGISATPIPQ
ncbi:TetR family transcriptional regulator [Mycetocola tolaasinivorans]|uniref:TetR family transcriptional regulator n=1 Tax=Mycetocola tolaasinivorans TaxID=76635 RepID=A0A3L7AA76_9MICO|nr:TetR/AcrR family transcriptional regulator C-terminal domain-containing protein [Mycetocola tolaasinivorans]RLP76561.1 TetR family transcriptional regulator [Mycetocola tolaasinivorans]